MHVRKVTRDTCYKCGKPIVWADVAGDGPRAYDMDPLPFRFGTDHALVLRRSRDGSLEVLPAERARPVPTAAHYRHSCIRVPTWQQPHRADIPDGVL